MKNMLVGLAATVSLTLSGCVIMVPSYHQPAPSAVEAWEKSGATVETTRADLKACQYVDDVSQINKTKFEAQTQCMKSKGYTINIKLYNAHNCYGHAPAMCALTRMK
ncbi:hypothetical protein [Psychrobacter sp. FDAARGOS_221]|uniref:hypothetical protein n=1 Tax=Psychrobacter sp. FDAARGOS_221 TaxID=1975705 RepID=UPI000BB59F0A|nr:hypothetical protein [Psychrobacter sp. FDAARGOS_221]PNK61657.1 hypothetical protein A6J60_012805 [Psychrobacter sp. FDAARGOS_221]